MVEKDDKTLLEEASACKGVSLNRYIIFAAMKDAKEDATEEEQLVLSSSDRAIVMDALEKAPELNTHLKGLFSDKRHRFLVARKPNSLFDCGKRAEAVVTHPSSFIFWFSIRCSIGAQGLKNALFLCYKMLYQIGHLYEQSKFNTYLISIIFALYVMKAI